MAMKKTIILLSLAVIGVSCNHTKPATEAADSATTGSSTSSGNIFGAAVPEADAMPAAQLTDAITGKDSLQVTVAAEVVESCQAKGCWMDVKLADNTTMKVTFRDYGFFVPVEDLKGRQVIFTGTARREVVSVADQRHYAEDAGKSREEIAAITAPKEELRFVADGVILK